VIVLKLRAARERKRRKTGHCEGGNAFGTHPGEVRMLARMRELRRKPKCGERLSLAAITERLNAEGHSTRSGRHGQRAYNSGATRVSKPCQSANFQPLIRMWQRQKNRLPVREPPCRGPHPWLHVSCIVEPNWLAQSVRLRVWYDKQARRPRKVPLAWVR
jgi:hypothetical protein